MTRVAAMTMNELDQEAGNRLFEQADELWIRPEVERRRAEGLLDETFAISKAQIIFREGERPEVRLNDEVNAVAKVKTKGPVKKGDFVSLADVEKIVSVSLTDRDPDAGHITLLAGPDGFFIAFDSLQNATKARKTLDVSRQFLATAEWAIRARRPNAAADALFSAAELIARAELMLLPIEGHESRQKVDHKVVRRTYRRRTEINWTRTENAELLDRLTRLRGRARYGGARLVEPDLLSLLEQTRQMERAARRRVPRRVKVSGQDRRHAKGERMTAMR
jgi:hypothetical protein